MNGETELTVANRPERKRASGKDDLVREFGSDLETAGPEPSRPVGETRLFACWTGYLALGLVQGSLAGEDPEPSSEAAFTIAFPVVSGGRGTQSTGADRYETRCDGLRRGVEAGSALAR